MNELDIFIRGENINLCVPTEEFALKSDWYSWFNDPDINLNLDQGLFPNTPQSQFEFLKTEKDKRLVLIVQYKQKYVGVVSLSAINYQKRSAQFAIVINYKADMRASPYIALEAAALTTEHGIAKMGMERIWAGQHVRLAAWGQRLELLGYRVEGIASNSFVKGLDVNSSLMIACGLEDYRRLVEKRGRYWDSLALMKKRAERLPKRRFADMLQEFLAEVGSEYYSQIESL